MTPLLILVLALTKFKFDSLLDSHRKTTHVISVTACNTSIFNVGINYYTCICNNMTKLENDECVLLVSFNYNK